METQQETMSEFATRNNLSLASVQIPARPDRLMSDMPKGSFHFVCTISNEQQSVTMNYSMGPGHAQRYWPMAPWPSRSKTPPTWSKPENEWPNVDWEDSRHAPPPRRGTIAYAELPTFPPVPNIAELLDSLAMDASTWDNGDFSGIECPECGHMDSTIRDACANTARDLRALLGDAEYDKLLYHVERM